MSKMDLSEDAKLLAGATGAVLAADQIMKSIDSEEHKVSHAVKAGISAAIAVGAYEMLRREADDNNHERVHHHRSRRSSSASRRSISPHDPKHHSRHLAEQILGAYGLGKELMGDKRHHVAHLVEEAIGAVGLIQDVKGKEEEREEHKLLTYK